MLGRPNCAEPVLAKSLAGAWLKTSVATDLTNARSSTTSAMCGKQLRDPRARLAVPGELADRPQQLGLLLGEDIHEREPPPLDERVRDRLAAVLLKLGLVVEQLELAGAAGHEQVDDALGPRGKMARPGRQGIGAAGRWLVARGRGGSRSARHRAGCLLAPESEARAIAPSPTPQSAKKWRRVRSRKAWSSIRRRSKSPVMADHPSRLPLQPITLGSRIRRG